MKIVECVGVREFNDQYILCVWDISWVHEFMKTFIGKIRNLFSWVCTMYIFDKSIECVFQKFDKCFKLLAGLTQSVRCVNCVSTHPRKFLYVYEWVHRCLPESKSTKLWNYRVSFNKSGGVCDDNYSVELCVCKKNNVCPMTYAIWEISVSS